MLLERQAAVEEAAEDVRALALPRRQLLHVDVLQVEVDDDVIEKLALVETEQILIRHFDSTLTRRRVLEEPEPVNVLYGSDVSTRVKNIMQYNNIGCNFLYKVNH